MYCKNCGSQIADQAVYCVHCGTATDVGFSVPSQPALCEKRTNGFAVAGFVLALVGLLLCNISILGLIFSCIGLVNSKTYGSGKGLSIAGLVISVIAFVILLVVVIFIFIMTMFGTAVPHVH